MAERKPPSPAAKEQVVAAWAGVSLTIIAILGLLAAPGARLLWIVLLVFGVATIRRRYSGVTRSAAESAATMSGRDCR